MTRTSRARRRLHVVESIPTPDRHEAQEPSSAPAESSEVPKPDSDDQADLDAAATGMVMLLRMALRLMQS